MILKKNDAVEGVRGVACLAVCFSHLIYTFLPQLHDSKYPFNNNIERIIFDSPFNFWYSGTAAVYVFFVLSGYILTYSIFKKENRIEQIASMTLKRFPRLMVPALISCVLAWMIFHIPDTTSGVSEWFQGYYNKNDKSLLTAIKEGGYTVFFGSGYSSFNYVLWTMKYELLGSLMIFFLCTLSLDKTYQHVFGVISAIVIGLYFGISSAGYLAFIIGYFLYHYEFKLSNFTAVVFLLTGLYFAGASTGSASYLPIPLKLQYFLSGVLIVPSILFSPMLNRAFSNKFCVFLGKVSFSVYLTHMPVMFLVCTPIFSALQSHMSYYYSALIASVIFLLVEYFIVGPIFYKYFDTLGLKVGYYIVEKVTSLRNVTSSRSADLTAKKG